MTKETIKQIVTMCVAFIGSLIGAILGCQEVNYAIVFFNVGY